MDRNNVNSGLASYFTFKLLSNPKTFFFPVRPFFCPFFYLVHQAHDKLRADFDHNEEMHQSTPLGEWSIMFGYEMGSSLAGIFTTVKTSLVKNFKHELENDVVATGNIFVLGRFFGC